MLTIKIQCSCGQKYSFEVDPGVERIPPGVQCPVCGADGTVAANGQLRALRDTQVPPVLKPQLSMPVQQNALRTAMASANTRPPSRRPPPEVPFYENAAMASNPGRLWVDWGRVFSTHRLAFIILFIIVFAGVAMGTAIHPSLFIMAAAGFWMVFSKCRLTKWKFISGDVCPGIIISESPPLVAVLTNLNAAGGFNPVIRISRQRLKGMTGGPPCIGMRVATVAHYVRPIKNDIWSDFDPEVINCCATDETEIQRVFDSIPQKDWDALDTGLAQISVRKVGLYRLWGRSPALAAQFRPGTARPGSAPPVMSSANATPGTPYGGMKSAFGWRNAGVAVTIAITIVIAIAKRLPQIEKKLQERKGSSQTFPTNMFPELPPAGRGSGRIPPPEFQQSPVTPQRATTPPLRAVPRGVPATVPRSMPGAAPRGVPGIVNAAPGDKVEVQWGASWWPATVVKREGLRTLVHYDGYDTNSDEWVTPGRMRSLR